MPAETALLQLDDLPPRQICLKCDSDIFSQTDGSLLKCDIAHQRQTVSEAMQELDAALLAAWQGTSAGIRLVVGGGVIRNEAMGQLHYYEQRGFILGYQEEGGNRGALIVRIRQQQ